MTATIKSRNRNQSLDVEFLLPWIILAALITVSILYFVYKPYLGFNLTYNKITAMMESSSNPDGNIALGDVILRMNDVTQEDVAADLTRSFLTGIKPGDTIEVTISRGGQEMQLQYRVPGPTPYEIFQRLNSNWFIPYIFWMAGTAALFFLRPKNQTRLLLILFCYITALWLSFGMLSNVQLFKMALLLRAAVWLSVPIYLHLHWLFPTPLKPLPGWAWGTLYTLCAVLAVGSWLQWLPEGAYMIGFILALLGSLILLVVHAITQPTERRNLLGLAIALVIVVLPVIINVLITQSNIKIMIFATTIMGLAALPGFYFFTLFRRQFSGTALKKVGRVVWVYAALVVAGFLVCLVIAFYMAPTGSTPMYDNLTPLAVMILVIIALVSFAPFLVLPALADEKIRFSASGLTFSANRAAAGVFFILGEIIVVLLGVLLAQRAGLAVASPAGLALAALAAGLLTLLAYPPFQRWFERLALGMKLVPESLLSTYSERITTSLQTDALRRLLLDEVLPSLLVRQFAQVRLNNGALQPHILLRVEADDLPAPAGLPAAAGQALPPQGSPNLPAWVRLVLPLRVANETRGYWLLGARDPDNQYSDEDIDTLKSLAGQTALALVNIEQADNLQAFYFADIGRNEAERAALAAELHDDVLNQMAVINNHLPDGDAASQQAYDTAVAHIRDIINGLRPAMLSYGLYPALESLVDDLNDRQPDGARVVLNLPPSEARHAHKVELAIFRIVQQACSNAIQHASCQRIEISGSLGADQVHLQVQDDGQGFDTGEKPDLPALLAGRHFGLVGMYERAALIGADLRIQSAPGQGSRVMVEWLKK